MIAQAGTDRTYADDLDEGYWDLYQNAFIRLTDSDSITETGDVTYDSSSPVPLFEVWRPNAPLGSTADAVGRVLDRLRALRKLGVGRGGRAAAANADSVDDAMLFIGRAILPAKPYATLDDEGDAVIEMADEDVGYHADITFLADGRIEIYARRPGEPSFHHEGHVNDEALQSHLRNHLNVLI